MKKLLIALLFPVSAFAQSVTVDVPPHSSVSVQIQTNQLADDSGMSKEKICALDSRMVRAIALDAQSGVSLKAALKFADDKSVFGNSTKLVHIWTVGAHHFVKTGATPDEIQDGFYQNCMSQLD